jgi:hypothetical protein
MATMKSHTWRRCVNVVKFKSDFYWVCTECDAKSKDDDASARNAYFTGGQNTYMTAIGRDCDDAKKYIASLKMGEWLDD